MLLPIRVLLRQGLVLAALDCNCFLIEGKRGRPGLFPATQSGKEAAKRAFQEGLLQVSILNETCGELTNHGWDWLRGEGAVVLDDFLRQLEQWKDQDRAVLSKVKESLGRLDCLSGAIKRLANPGVVEKKTPIREIILQVLHHFPGGSSPCLKLVDNPLPDLRRSVEKMLGVEVSLGIFHDTLREMHAVGEILLHPWTGTIYSIPEPAAGLLVGHEVVYYASLNS